MANLNPGDQAPAFSAKNQNGETISLSDFAGKPVILYFYPKDDTPGCTAEACSFRDNYEALQAKGYVVIGVSTDDEKSHTKFVNKYNLPFNLIADTDKNIVEAYGVWVEKSMYGKTYMGTARKTFIINPEGKIAHIIEKVDTKNSSQQVLDLVG
jgi:peroxiredoxin Q/BCP